MKIFDDRYVTVEEGNLARMVSRVAGAGAGLRWIGNKVTGSGNGAGFRSTVRDATFNRLITQHAWNVKRLLDQMRRFINQEDSTDWTRRGFRASEKVDTTHLKVIANDIGKFLEDTFGWDYERYELPDGGGKTPDAKSAAPSAGTPTDGADSTPPSSSDSITPAVETPGPASESGVEPHRSKPLKTFSAPVPASDAAPPSTEASAPDSSAPTTEVPPASGPTDSGTPSPESAASPAPTGGGKVKRRGNWMDLPSSRPYLESVGWMREGVEDFMVLLDMGNENLSAGRWYNAARRMSVVAEGVAPQQTQAGGQQIAQMNEVATKIFSQLGDMADKGDEQDKDFVYGIIQKLAAGSGSYTMRSAMQDMAAYAEQKKSRQVQGTGQQVATEAFEGLKRRFYARQAGKAAAKAGGDRKAAEKEAYDNRVYEFKTRLDRALGELSLDLKTMGYKDKAGEADALLKGFRQAIARYSQSGKEEGQTSWLQRRVHGLGHWAATAATYAALRAICPATILGNKYLGRAVYGAATSVIRDVSRDNLNKKSIMRALIGAGIAAGGSYVGDKIGSYIKGAMGGQGNAVGVANGGVNGNGTVENAATMKPATGGNATFNGRDWGANPGQVKMMANNIGMANGLNPNLSMMTQNLAADNPEIIDILQDKNSVEQINQMYRQYWDSLPPVGDPGRKAAVQAGREALKKSIQAMAKSRSGLPPVP